MKQIFQKKPIAKLMQESKQKTLARTLGALDLTMLGIGAIVGTGIFVLTGVVAAKHSGPAIILSFAIAALACALLHFVMLNSLLQFLSQAVCIRTHMRRWEKYSHF